MYFILILKYVHISKVSCSLSRGEFYSESLYTTKLSTRGRSYHKLSDVNSQVACTNWKRVLLIMSGKMNTTDPKKLRPSLVHGELSYRYLRTLVSYSPDEIEYRLRNYFKVSTHHYLFFH